MKDEKYVFLQDIAEKKSTGRSAFNRKPHGKGGAVRLPSDYLSKKEREAMNGECMSYRLNDPMKWKEFKKLPDDLKKVYIQQIRTRYNAKTKDFCELFGCSHTPFENLIRRLGLGTGTCKNHYPCDREAFTRWLHGLPAEVQEEEQPEDQAVAEQNGDDLAQEFQEVFESLPVQCEEPKPTIGIAPHLVPRFGTLTFIGHAQTALREVAALLRNESVKITVSWERADLDE